MTVNTVWLRSLCALCVLCVFVVKSSAADPTYWQDVRPVLRKNCTACHNARKLGEPDVSGGLALDNYEAVLKGGKNKVVLAGKSADSLLIKLVTIADEEKRMPQGALPLGETDVALLKHWIDAGAKEGDKPDATETTVATTPPKLRKLDVLLPTDAVAPKELAGTAAPAKLSLALKVGPLSPLTAVTFSPDGKLLACGSYGQVTVWDLTAGKPAKVLTNVLGTVNDLRFSPDGTLLAAAGGQPSAKGDLRLFQVADWKHVATLPGHDDVVFSVAFSPDGKRLASASFDKTVRLWDVAGRKLERTLTGHSDFVYAVAFSPDGTWLASASKDRSVKLTEADTGKSLLTFSGMDQDVLAVAVSPDGKTVVSSGYETSLFWWNAQTGERIRAQGGHGVAVHEVAFSKDGKLVVSAGGDKTVRLWDGASGAPLRALAVGSMVYAAALSPDGKLVASGSFDGLLRVWEAGTGRQLATLLATPHGDEPDWLAVTPEGYAAASKGFTELAQWRMGAQPVAAEAAWKAFGNPEAVAKAVRGEK
jgi:WD40 repeat protein